MSDGIVFCWQCSSGRWQADWWQAVLPECINVWSEPCTSSYILGTVWSGDTILATRERSSNWMKLVDVDGQGACWVFRGDEDDLFEFVKAGDTDQSAGFEGDYWTVSTEATRDMGINVRNTSCMSGSISGTVWAGDVVLLSYT